MVSTAAPTRPTRFGPLRHRAFRRFWLGAFVSNIGTWMETIAVGIFITTAALVRSAPTRLASTG